MAGIGIRMTPATKLGEWIARPRCVLGNFGGGKRTVLRRVISLIFAVFVLCVAVTWRMGSAEREVTEGFSSASVDIALVVSDEKRAAAFYRDALGFQEIEGFSVPGDFLGEVGLTDGKPDKVRQFVLGPGKHAVRVKLITVPGASPERNESRFIHSELGYRFMTLQVANIDSAVARLKRAGIEPLGKYPRPLPKGFSAGVYLMVVRDPDGNLIELSGPKRGKP